jgi:hypothetical protein
MQVLRVTVANYHIRHLFATTTNLRMAKSKTESPVLNRWSKILKFLGQPVSGAERWEKPGYQSSSMGGMSAYRVRT